MTWFTKLTGINEGSPDQIRETLSVDGDCLICPNGRQLAFGRFETPKLSQLRVSAANCTIEPSESTIREVVGNVTHLHADRSNADALFQVASQFNLLEMTSPGVTPEQGVGIYENDYTQGPACAIACGAGTIYRNYFAHVDGQIGQTAKKQIDCSADLGRSLGNRNGRLWGMQNGYLLPTDEGLREISSTLQSMSEDELDQLRGELRIGCQWHADVTIDDANHKVSQAYCSALPVAYGEQPKPHWVDFARFILDAAYEATFCAAAINASRTGVNTVFLTLLGGGVFGNDDDWIVGAIERAYAKFHQHGLDIRIVSYGSSNPVVANLAKRLTDQRLTN
ncbi:hypothetical protein [Rhodopirellula sallentina]|uniref:Macro domain-containing protein n=1 Tax=Rhodopirellula sallentina SM41 TaxID=1263870 RepID=M5U908_9BACT|nr:hypothetical protein [Rhodopirellula sallentina]EMI57744.1 hypothetical protein RSSM_00792 [Rhodopirellula sallentina SM41]